MIRRILPLMLIAAIALVGLVTAQEPDPGDGPVRLKKKDRPPEQKDPSGKPADLNKEDPDKNKDDMKDPVPEEKRADPLLTEDPKQVLARIDRNLKDVVGHLQKDDLTEGTREHQNDILKDLESLINQKENPPPQGSGGKGSSGGGSKSNTGQSKPQASPGSNPKGEQGTSTKTGSRPMPQTGSSGTQLGSMARTPAPQGSTTSGSGARGSPPPKDKIDPTNVEDLAWGNLPAVLRPQTNTYQMRRGYSQRNSDLVDAYRRALAAPRKDQGD